MLLVHSVSQVLEYYDGLGVFLLILSSDFEDLHSQISVRYNKKPRNLSWLSHISVIQPINY